MNPSSKPSSAQVFRLLLYRRPLHPELFDLQARRSDRYGEYEVESWLTPGGHVLRFQIGEQGLTETVVENGDHLPENGLVQAMLCMGERDYEAQPQPRVRYVTTVQTEVLNENLFEATRLEMQELASETQSIRHEWTDPETERPCLSLLDTQGYRREFHLQSYHLLAGSGTVLRTQSIFELTADQRV